MVSTVRAEAEQAFTELNRGRRRQSRGFQGGGSQVGRQRLGGVFQAEESPNGFLQFAKRDQPALVVAAPGGPRGRFAVGNDQGDEDRDQGIQEQ